MSKYSTGNKHNLSIYMYTQLASGFKAVDLLEDLLEEKSKICHMFLETHQDGYPKLELAIVSPCVYINMCAAGLLEYSLCNAMLLMVLCFSLSLLKVLLVLKQCFCTTALMHDLRIILEYS